jgi:hypothetical protein
MVHQVGVQRVVACDHHDQRALAAATRAAGLLPERRDGPREARQHHRVQAGDVDAELQGIGGGKPAQFAFGQGPFELAAVLGQIPGSVGGHPLGQIGRDILQPGARTQCRQLGAPAGPDERQRPRALGDQVGHHPGRFGAGGTSYRSAVFADDVLAQGRLP